jgi:hypothetical protein
MLSKVVSKVDCVAVNVRNPGSRARIAKESSQTGGDLKVLPPGVDDDVHDERVEGPVRDDPTNAYELPVRVCPADAPRPLNRALQRLGTLEAVASTAAGEQGLPVLWGWGAESRLDDSSGRSSPARRY